MKKFFLISMFCLLLVLMFSCDNLTNNNKNDDSIDLIDLKDYSGENIEISFYNRLAATNTAIINKIIHQFTTEIKEKYNINVNVETEYHLDDNVLPTVMMLSSHEILEYLQKNLFNSLDIYAEHHEYGLIGTKELSYGFVDSYFENCCIYNKERTLYCLPFYRTTEVLYYNTELFEKYDWEIPQTWDDVTKICEAWKQTDEYLQIINNNQNSVGLGIDSNYNLFKTLTKQWGSSYSEFDQNGNGKFLFNNVNTKNALRWLVDEFNKGNIATPNYLNVNYVSDAFEE